MTFGFISYVEDGSGDLVDINYYCSQACATDSGDDEAAPPVVKMDTDFAVYCYECGSLMWEGLEDDLGVAPDANMVELAPGVYVPWTPPAEQLGMVLSFAS